MAWIAVLMLIVVGHPGMALLLAFLILFFGIDMYEVYEGDFLLFTTNDVEEVEYYRIEGYTVRKV